MDTGAQWWSKPRWAVVRDGVFVIHRRAFMTGTAARRYAGRRSAEAPIPLASEPGPALPGRSRSFARALAWPLGGSILFAVIAVLSIGAGDPVRWVGGL